MKLATATRSGDTRTPVDVAMPVALVARGQRLGLLEAQRCGPDRQRPGAGLGDQHLGAVVVDVAFAHQGAVGECRVERCATVLLGVQRDHRDASGAQVVEAVGAADDDHLGVAHLALQARAVLDH
ncbi:hypothetical protein MSMEI_4759 [Mycolicibacterium smegmatis MC2 155]|uniref:Uncharacterized protein n=1 Tax=Mycolicibacterium smegmatis (strain ATCC 700084 / mc(2)155) TaxID=246196 RepID=I7FR14_MYCS2|nr:hypothetical protein MSMEI_4759 [Mycolicibacterium smegmatis MC2 155]